MRRPSRCLLPLCCAALALTATGAPAGTPPFVSDSAPDAPKSVKPGKDWEEEQVQLPPWPAPGDLIPIKLDGPDRPVRYFIDGKSLRTGRDGVVRYTLIARPGGGADNLTFEGLRCTPQGRYRIYAYGSDGSFTEAGLGEEWQSIDPSEPYREELWRHYLCVPRLFAPRSHKDQLRMLKSGRVPPHDNTGFIAD